MTRQRWISIAAAVAALGGAAWMTKFGVIVATDGATTDTGAAAVFYLLGVALMLVGSTWVGARLAAARGHGLFALLLLLSPLLVFASYAVLDGVAKAAVGDSGPAWLADEAGIALTGLAWLVIGLLGRRRAQRRSATPAARRLVATGVLVLLAGALAACGGDDDEDPQTASADYCDVAREVDAAGEELPPDLLDRYVEVAPEQIRSDAELAANAIKERGDAAFGDPRVGEALGRIEAFETSECGIEHEEQ